MAIALNVSGQVVGEATTAAGERHALLSSGQRHAFLYIQRQ